MALKNWSKIRDDKIGIEWRSPTTPNHIVGVTDKMGFIKGKPKVVWVFFIARNRFTETVFSTKVKALEKAKSYMKTHN